MTNKNDWKKRSGVVFSTDPDFAFNNVNEGSEQKTLPANQQKLYVQLDKKQRGGKLVTLVTGFIGSTDALEDLCKKLKSKCGVGGSAKDGEIIIQGDNKEKVGNILRSEGYNYKFKG